MTKKNKAGKKLSPKQNKKQQHAVTEKTLEDNNLKNDLKTGAQARLLGKIRGMSQKNN